MTPKMWLGLSILCIGLAITHGASVQSRIKRQISNDCPPLDMIFVLDSSGSVGANNWQKVLEFVKDFVDSEGLTVGEADTRIGILTYGNRGTIQFHLTRYYDTNEMKDAIDRIPWKDEATNTSGAIRVMREQMFTPENGDRTDSPNVCIVITDGESNRDANLTIPESDLAREQGIFMFAVGIGDQVKMDELNGIGNDPDSEYVFQATGFDTLNSIRTAVLTATCQVNIDCNFLNDLVFILDSSGSVGETNFNIMKSMVSEILPELGVDPGRTRVGLMTFSSDAQIEFQLDRYDNVTLLENAFNAVKYTAGSTNTGEALRRAREEMFTEGNGDRNDRDNVIVLFTDGGSNDFTNTLEQAVRAKTEGGITILVVAVGNWLNKFEVNAIASDPDAENVYYVPDFSTISSIRESLKTTVCNNVDECSSNPCQNGGQCVNSINKYYCVCPENFVGVNCEMSCRENADVIFSLDSSSSIGDENYFLMLDLVKDVTKRLNINADQNVGLQTFADDEATRFELNEYSTTQDVLAAISFPYSRGTTNTAAALRNNCNSLFGNGDRGDRNSARNIGVYITDGESNNREETFNEAVSCHNDDVTLMSIGVNIRSFFGTDELEGIASDPNSQNMMTYSSFETLFADSNNVAEKLLNAVCNNVDECESNPCQNSGQCMDEVNGYMCMCNSGRSGRNCQRNCDGVADIIFMVDSSGSIRENRFQIVKDFVNSIIDDMDVSENGARVGLVQFSDDAMIKFNLNTYKHKQDIKQAVQNLEYLRGKTNLAGAINSMRQMFNSGDGDRSDAPNFGILVTDGFATVDNEGTLPAAIDARIEGVHMIVAAPENLQDSLELKGIASDPDAENIVTVAKFSEMPSMTDTVLNSMCDDTDECNSNPCQNDGVCVNGLKQYLCLCQDRFTGASCERSCTRRADVVFVIDVSGSTEDMVSLSIELTKKIVQGLNFQGARTRVGVATYDDNVNVRFQLDKYTDQLEVLNAIAFLKSSGRTNTADAITAAYSDMFTSSNGDRSGDPNYMIVLTDGRSNVNPEGTIPEASSAKNNGITVISVGVGSDVDRSEIEGIASDPDNEHAFFMATEADLENAANSVLDTICA